LRGSRRILFASVQTVNTSQAHTHTRRVIPRFIYDSDETWHGNGDETHWQQRGKGSRCSLFASVQTVSIWQRWNLAQKRRRNKTEHSVGKGRDVFCSPVYRRWVYDSDETWHRNGDETKQNTPSERVETYFVRQYTDGEYIGLRGWGYSGLTRTPTREPGVSSMFWRIYQNSPSMQPLVFWPRAGAFGAGRFLSSALSLCGVRVNPIFSRVNPILGSFVRNN